MARNGRNLQCREHYTWAHFTDKAKRQSYRMRALPDVGKAASRGTERQEAPRWGSEDEGGLHLW